MANTATLRELQNAQYAYLVVVDGLPYAWTNVKSLAQVPDFFGDGRVIHDGYEPGRRTLSILPFEGRMQSNRARFRIMDKRSSFYGAEQNYLADLFKTVADYEALALTLDPASTGPAATYDKHIGTEAIGSAGERRRYPFVNGWSVGDHHLGTDWEHTEFPTADVSDDPILFRGRRVALYRVFRDHYDDYSASTVFRPDMRTMDDPHSGITGTAGGTTYADSNAARVNVSNGPITWGNPKDLTSSGITVSYWIRDDDATANGLHVALERADGAQGFWIRAFGSDGRLQFFDNHDGGGSVDLNVVTTSGFTGGQWHHIAVTYPRNSTAADVHIYLDGVELAYGTQTDGSGTPRDLDGNVVALNFTSGAAPVDGRVADLRIHDAVLTPSEVADLAAASPWGWRPWSEAEILWWGTLADAGSVDGPVWTLEADGPESLLEGQLGTLSQTHGAAVRPPIVLDDSAGTDETAVGVYMFGRRSLMSTGTPAFEHYVADAYSTYTLSTSYDTTHDLAAAIDTIIETALGVSGTDGAAEDSYNQDAGMISSSGAVFVRTGDDAGSGGTSRFFVMQLSMHRKVWEALGWHKDQGNVNNALDLPENQWIAFVDPSEDGFPAFSTDTDPTEPPAAGYWTLIFNTATKEQQQGDNTDFAEWDNGGEDRVYYPLYDGGIGSLPANLGTGVELEFSLATDQISHTGQLDRPIASEPGDPTTAYQFGGNDAERQGCWFVVGPRQQPGQDEDFEDVQIFRASWDEGHITGTVGPGIDPEVVVTRWLDPRDFGIDRQPMSILGDWTVLSNDVQQAKIHPAFNLNYAKDGSWNRPELVMLRLMLSTGGSTGWDSFQGDPGAGFDNTSNEPTTTIPANFDGEIRDLGLAIPKELVRDPYDWVAEFDKLPDGKWREFRMLARPGFQTNDLFDGLFAFYGLSWSLHGGVYGVRAMTESFTLEDVEVTITAAEKAVDPGRPQGTRTRQTLRVYQPINDFEIEWMWDSWDESFTEKLRLRANDRGARYRSRGHTYKAKAYGIKHIQGFRQRATQIARFYEKRHFLLEDYPIKSRIPGQDIWPGTIVSITDAHAVSPLGTYGITTHVGMVLKISEDLSPGDGVKYTADILVQEDSAQTPRLHGPSGLLVSYDDGDPYVVTIEDNHVAAEDADWLDANGFIEPDWSESGGNIDIKCMAYDGYEWIEAWTATVTSVTPGSSNTSTLTLSGAVTGTHYRDMVNVIVPREYDNQGAQWVLDYIATIGDETGEFGSGPTTSSRWHL